MVVLCYMYFRDKGFILFLQISYLLGIQGLLYEVKDVNIYHDGRLALNK